MYYTLWNLLQDVRIVIYQLDKQESILHLYRGVHRQQGESSDDLQASLLYAKDALEQRKPAGCPANGSTSKKTQKLDSITESHQECDTNNEHSPMGMKEVKKVTSKTESGERGVVCGTDEKATIMEVTATLVMPSLSPAPCLCTSGRWRPTSPT